MLSFEPVGLVTFLNKEEPYGLSVPRFHHHRTRRRFLSQSQPLHCRCSKDSLLSIGKKEALHHIIMEQQQLQGTSSPSPSPSPSPPFSEPEEELQRMPLVPPRLKGNKRLSKQRSMCETPRDIAWEKRRRQILRQESKKYAINDGEYITDEDLNELKGCIELGFGFNEEEGHSLCNTLPALDLYFAVNRQLSPSPVSTPQSRHSISSLGGRSSSFGSPKSDSDSWKICSPVRQKVQQFLNAACLGNIDLLKNLANQLDEGKGMAKSVADIKDGNKRGALHFAAREGKTEVCKYLLEELKLDVDTKDDDGETPLIHAARQGHVDTAKYLIESGANIMIASDLGATALHHSAGIGNIELLQYLLAKGADVDSQSDAGTPLIWAAGHSQQEAVKVLLEHHANPNAETDDDITPLLSAVAAGSLACLDLLIEAGARVNVSAGGATPLHIAADSDSVPIIDRLLRAGADANMSDEDELKPIHVAASRGSREAVEILFPLTTTDQTIPKWTVDGILNHMQSQNSKYQKETSQEEAGAVNDPAVPNLDLPEVSPEAKKKAAEAKSRGDDAFKRKDFHAAIDAYTQAIDLDSTDAAIFSNRSLCWIRVGQAEHALADAKVCRALRPNWAKACYREGAALRLLQRFDEAASSFYEGVTLDPENMEIVNAFREAVESGRKKADNSIAKVTS